jgi:hypothetical protein
MRLIGEVIVFIGRLLFFLLVLGFILSGFGMVR